MPSEQLFSISSLAAMAGWAALSLAPLRRSLVLAVARAVAATLAVLYVVLLVRLRAQGGGSDFSSLAGIAHAFAEPRVMLVGWIHYLAFDLWVGAWQVEEAGRRGMPHWVVVVCLLPTFLFGPVGLVLFLAARPAFRPRLAPAMS